MSKNFDFKGRLAGNNFGQQMNMQAASVVSTLAGRTAKDSGWAKNCMSTQNKKYSAWTKPSWNN